MERETHSYRQDLHLPSSFSVNKSRKVWRKFFCVFSLQLKYIHLLKMFFTKSCTQRIELYKYILLVFKSSVLMTGSPVLLSNQRNLSICEDHDSSLSNTLCTCLVSYLWSSIQVDKSVFISFPSDLADPITLNEISHCTLAFGSCSPSSSTS